MIIRDLANTMGANWNYTHPSEIMVEAASLAPMFAGVSYERLEGWNSQLWPVKPDGEDTPLLFTERFPFPDGKARLIQVDWLPPMFELTKDFDLHLNNGRLLEHFHEGNMTYKATGITHKVPNPWLEVLPELAEERDIKDGSVTTGFPSPIYSEQEGKPMAKAITNIERYIPTPEEEKQKAIQQVLDAVSENHQVLITLLDIVKELQEIGVLDIVQGALKNRHDIGVIAVSQLNQPGMHRIMKNGMNALQFLGKLEPGKLQNILNAVDHGIVRLTDTKSEKPMGLMGMGRAMMEPNVTLALGSMINFLRGMGEGMQEAEKHVH